jgi:hypothetical protein
MRSRFQIKSSNRPAPHRPFSVHRSPHSCRVCCRGTGAESQCADRRPGPPAVGRTFVFCAVNGTLVFPMGSDPALTNGLKPEPAVPLSGTFKVFRNGIDDHPSRGRNLQLSVTRAGACRIENWLNFRDESQIRIFSNPIYIGLPPPERP